MQRPATSQLAHKETSSSLASSAPASSTAPSSSPSPSIRCGWVDVKRSHSCVCVTFQLSSVLHSPNHISLLPSQSQLKNGKPPPLITHPPSHRFCKSKPWCLQCCPRNRCWKCRRSRRKTCRRSKWHHHPSSLKRVRSDWLQRRFSEMKKMCATPKTTNKLLPPEVPQKSEGWVTMQPILLLAVTHKRLHPPLNHQSPMHSCYDM